MNVQDELQRTLLLFESPLTGEQEQVEQARRVCRAARKLLREDYDLDGDHPADAAPLKTRPLAGPKPLDREQIERMYKPADSSGARPSRFDPEHDKELKGGL